MSTFSHITREKVTECLRRVHDPVLKKDIITLGLVREISVEGAHVFLHMEDASGDATVRGTLKVLIERVLQEAGVTGSRFIFPKRPGAGSKVGCWGRFRV